MDVRRFPFYCYCASRFKFTIFTSRLSTAHLINVVTWRVYLLRDEAHKRLFFHPVVRQAVHLHHGGGLDGGSADDDDDDGGDDGGNDVGGGEDVHLRLSTLRHPFASTLLVMSRSCKD